MTSSSALVWQIYLTISVICGLLPDFKQRKFHYTRNYRYDIELQTSRRPLHVFLLILLAGDVATNPGPVPSKTFSEPVKRLLMRGV